MRAIYLSYIVLLVKKSCKEFLSLGAKRNFLATTFCESQYTCCVMLIVLNYIQHPRPCMLSETVSVSL